MYDCNHDIGVGPRVSKRLGIFILSLWLSIIGMLGMAEGAHAEDGPPRVGAPRKNAPPSAAVASSEHRRWGFDLAKQLKEHESKLARGRAVRVFSDATGRLDSAMGRYEDLVRKGVTPEEAQAGKEAMLEQCVGALETAHDEFLGILKGRKEAEKHALGIRKFLRTRRKETDADIAAKRLLARAAERRLGDLERRENDLDREYEKAGSEDGEFHDRFRELHRDRLRFEAERRRAKSWVAFQERRLKRLAQKAPKLEAYAARTADVYVRYELAAAEVEHKAALLRDLYKDERDFGRLPAALVGVGDLQEMQRQGRELNRQLDDLLGQLEAGLGEHDDQLPSKAERSTPDFEAYLKSVRTRRKSPKGSQ